MPASRQRCRLAQRGRVEALRELFCTDGEPRKRLMTKRLADAASRCSRAATRNARRTRFVALHDERKRAVLLDATMALLRLAGAVMQR